MLTAITSAQVAAAYGLSAVVSTTLPLSWRIDEAVGGLQSLEAYHAQGWSDLDPSLRTPAVDRTLGALRALPELVSEDEVRALEATISDTRPFAAQLVNLLGPLQQQSLVAHQAEEAAQTDQLLTLTRIVSGGDSYAGLPDVLSLRNTKTAYQAFPDWARRVIDQRGTGVELSFRAGRYWVRDRRDRSLLDLRNLFSSAGVYVSVGGGDARLKPGISWPVAPGQTVRVGKKKEPGVTVRLPEAPALETLRSAIAVAPSLPELSQLLRTADLKEPADQIDRFLKDGTPFDNLPMEGGLALKVQELVLKAEFARLHNHYLPGTGEGFAAQIFRSLAIAIGETHSAKELVEAVRSSLLPGASALAAGIALFLRQPHRQSIEVISNDFGLRERVVFFSKQAAAQLQKKTEGLGRQVAGLTADLESARAEAAREKEERERLVDRFFAGGDARLVKVDIPVRDDKSTTGDDGYENFSARIVAGGESGSIGYTFADGSRLSGKTTKGGRDYQQDGIYASWFTLPDRTMVKVMAGSDGAGGHGGGEVVSSAFLQGVHARVAEAPQEGRVPTAAELFQEGFRAALVQRKHPDRNQDQDPSKNADGGTGAGAIVVVVGNTAMIATAGDAMVVHARKTADGSYRTQGYSDVQTLAPVGLGNVITSGVHENKAKLYVVKDLQPGDRFLFGSDGLHENILGEAYKVVGANDPKIREVMKEPHPTQASFQALNLVLEATAGQDTAADSIHDTAQFKIDHPGGKVVELNGKQIQLPEENDEDNIFAVSYEHGTSPDFNVSLPDFHTSPLEVVAFGATQDQALQKRKQHCEDLTVGNDPNSDIFIPDGTVAPNQAFLGYNQSNGIWYIVDRAGANGTAVDGINLEPRTRATLRHGDELRLGGAFFRVHKPSDGLLQLVPVSKK